LNSPADVQHSGKKIVLMFPGQGSQSLKMGSRFLKFNDQYLDYFDTASSAAGVDILKIINGEDSRYSLDDTRFSQIAIFTLSCVLNDYLFRDLFLNGDSIYSVLGHSLGEYSALYCSGAYSLEDGVRLVSYRGKIMSMKNSGGKGMSMAAVIGTTPEVIRVVLKDYREKVFIANYNDYEQVVISGYKKDVEKAIADLQIKGAKRVITLKVNIASHCPLMKDVSEKLGKFIEENIGLKNLYLPFFSTTEVAYRNADNLKFTLTGQLVNPIRWVESVEYFLKQGIETFIEIGPGKVLSGLVGRIAKKNEKPVTVLNTSDLEDIEAMIENLQEEGLFDEA
jgi:[acyl-carrier-protein] S-malonyltransferase